MTALSIAKQVDAALGQVARQVGDGMGFKVVIRKSTNRSASPLHPETDQFEDVEINALVSEYKDRSIDGTVIQLGDKKVLIPAVYIVPSVTDGLILNSVLHSIINVSVLAPSGVAIYYEIQARA